MKTGKGARAPKRQGEVLVLAKRMRREAIMREPPTATRGGGAFRGNARVTRTRHDKEGEGPEALGPQVTPNTGTPELRG